MKFAVITTTIGVPKVLELYNPVDCYVTGDLKTPPETADFCNDFAHIYYFSPEKQRELAYKCCALVGWNTIGRRNIALLEALKDGATHIYTIDDDNIPMGNSNWLFLKDFLGLRAEYLPTLGSNRQKWFDVGQYLIPQARHRGFPISERHREYFQPVTNAKIGVWAGICLGDPDISAVDRISQAPIVHSVHEILKQGIVVDPNGTTVFNSQNTIFLRELAPAMFMLPGVGRYDDIFASIICQRVMRERGLHVHFGPPFVYQQRNAHNLLNDLKNELFGMEHVVEFARLVNEAPMPTQWGGSVAAPTSINQVREIYTYLYNHCNFLPPVVYEAAHAWLEDISKVLEPHLPAKE